jgi:hypothetical protein
LPERNARDVSQRLDGGALIDKACKNKDQFNGKKLFVANSLDHKTKWVIEQELMYDPHAIVFHFRGTFKNRVLSFFPGLSVLQSDNVVRI